MKENTYKIKFNESKNLFYVEIIGKINHLQIIGFLNIIYNSKINDEKLLLITDYRNAIIVETTASPIAKIGLFFNEKLKKRFRKIQWANISNLQLPTTGAMILANLIKGKSVIYQPFSTIEGLLNWMHLSYNDIDNLVPFIDHQ